MRSKLLLIYVVLCNRLVAALDFYVAPNGSDNNAGTSAATAFQTLQKAQQAVRSQIAGTMTGNITVQLGPGIYTLSEPLKFTADDSGKGGFTVNWVGSGALISGGRKVTGWVADSNGVYSARVPAGLKSRNLYVNGQASNYARKKIANRKDFTYTTSSIKWTSSSYDWITSTPGIANAEVRFINSFADRYAPIESAGSKELVMKQNTWYNQNWGYDTISKPNADFGVWIQNALALLTEGGQFYLDSGAGKVYYKPLSGEKMDSVEAYLGVSESLVILGGTYANPVHDISFEGISFVGSQGFKFKHISDCCGRHILPGCSQMILDILTNRQVVISARTRLMTRPILNLLVLIGAKCHLPSRSAQPKILFSREATTHSSAQVE